MGESYPGKEKDALTDIKGTIKESREKKEGGKGRGRTLNTISRSIPHSLMGETAMKKKVPKKRKRKKREKRRKKERGKKRGGEKKKGGGDWRGGGQKKKNKKGEKGGEKSTKKAKQGITTQDT